MKIKCFLLTLVIGLFSSNIQAQLLEKLKQRAEEKGLETREVSYDSTAYDESKDHSDEEGFKIESAHDLFNSDVVMELYDRNDQLVQTAFFDADLIAMRTETSVSAQPIFHDSKGYFYGFNDEEGRYEKMSILPASSMGFMMAGMTTQAYKLPQEPYFEAFEALSEKEIAMNFLIVELAFIYKPKHFEDDDNYRLQSVPCFPDVCKRFYYNDPEYQGSYIQFDAKDRLVEFYINSTNAQMADNKNPSGKFIYSYKNCSVKLPDAVEQSMVPGPLGKMLNLERGLEPWKHNKKDKQKN
ncbi:hypothetical protein OE09_2448 [Flavobacteriaceae bacterium MAR_2010_72]|nr:hypothetical protein OE09_2448 [Flavobacteriaceae bacterium MAR_2010_72]